MQMDKKNKTTVNLEQIANNLLKDLFDFIKV